MKIAIAGYGVEGQQNYEYWAKDPSNEVTIVDEAEHPKFDVPEGAATILGPGSFEKLEGFDLVVRTAGLAPKKIHTDGKIWTATNEFFAKCPVDIIGVTGTKGKGTTSTMITRLLEAGGKKVHLIGNIGTAALGILGDIQAGDIVVFEMSSFQLWDIERSPHAAVVLGIEPDHLNVHDDMEDYVLAKGNIRRFQGDEDICVFKPGNDYVEQIVALSNKGQSIPYGISTGGGVFVYEGDFKQNEHIICSTDQLHVPGDHNKDNACAAITVALYYGVTDEEIAKGLSSFEGLPHRLEKVRELDGVTYYNDSFSSAPSATVAAITSFDSPELLILGGIDKKANFSDLVKTIHDKGNVKELVLIGEVRHSLESLLKEANVGAKVTVLDVRTMKEIVEYARSEASNGDIVILSPGCASFDMFKDFYDRGDQFRDEVNRL